MSFGFKKYEKNINLIEDFLKYILKNVDGNYSPITTTDTETNIKNYYHITDKLHEDGLEIVPTENSGLTDGQYEADVDVNKGTKIKIEVKDGDAKILKVLNHGSGYSAGIELEIAKNKLGNEGDDSKLTIKVNEVFSLFDIFNKNVDPTNKDTLKKNIINFIKKSRNLKYKIIKNIAYKNTIKTHISAKHYFNDIIKGVNNNNDKISYKGVNNNNDKISYKGVNNNNDKISYYIDFNKDYDLLNNIIQHYRLISEAYFGKISTKLVNKSETIIKFIDKDTDIKASGSNKAYGTINLTIKASTTEIPNHNKITITKIDKSELDLVEILKTNSSTLIDGLYEYNVFSDIDDISKESSKNINLENEDLTIKFKLTLITTKDDTFFKEADKKYKIFLKMLEINDDTYNDVINHIEIENYENSLENAMNELKYNNNKQKEFLNKYLAVYLGPVIFEKYNLIDIIVFCIIILVSVLLYFLRTYMSVYISGILLLIVVLIMTFLAIIFN
jgi:hypothetical protein